MLDIQTKSEKLLSSIYKLREKGKALAQAEYDYQVAKAQEVLKLKDAGNPVTMISLIVKGVHNVALARLKRDVAEVEYKANQEYINALKLDIKVDMSVYEREFDNEA